MFDLYALPLHLVQGQEQPDLPGLLITTAPKRSERARREDILILLVTMSGGEELPDKVMDSLLHEIAAVYYATPGPVTTGLQSAAVFLNEYLLKTNVRKKRDEKQALAMLNLVVARRELLYIAHGGPVHTFLMTPEGGAEDYCDAQATPRSLGLGRTVSLRYFQHALTPDTMLVLCAKAPDGWTKEFMGSTQQLAIESLRRRLVNRVGGGVQSAIIQFKTGTAGETVSIIHRLRRKSGGAATAETPGMTGTETNRENAKAGVYLSGESLEVPRLEKPGTEKPGQVIPPGRITPTSQRSARDSQKPAITQEEVEEEEKPSLLEELATKLPRFKLPRINSSAARKKTAAAFRDGTAFRQRFSEGLNRFFARLLPGRLDQIPKVPSSILVFIAVAVPLIIVAIATTVYFRSGRSTEYQRLFQKVQEAAIQAEAQKNDPILRKVLWEQTIKEVVKAEKYAKTDELMAIKQRAYLEIDLIDGITRVEVNPALVQNLPATVKITRIAATNSDVYLLDSNQGRILRLFWTAQKNYQLDTKFACSPGKVGLLTVDAFVDLVVLPPGSFEEASILAVDRTGTMVYCSAGKEMVAKQMVTDTGSNLQIDALAIQYSSLLVLDTSNNAVWRYDGEKFEFLKAPRLFFSEDIPMMSEVIDIAVYEEHLYLLHQNGRMTRCKSSPLYADEPTTCEDPAPYIDMRPGHEPETLSFADAALIQMQMVAPLEPSLYLLDASGSAVYHLGVGLNLYGQLRARPGGNYDLPDQPPTAFAITPDRTLILAFGNLVYFAQIP